MSRCIVSGGGGFVGRALCFKLKELGHEVLSLSRGSYPDLEQAGIRTSQVDLSREADKLKELAQGAEVFFHVAAKVDMWGPYVEFFNNNVVATRNVIECCKAAGIKRLVYTSSPSVIADGRDLLNIKEDYPYPRRHTAHYPATKAIAEREVLSASSKELWTLALRPHLIWGPGDTNLIPAILERGRKGRLVQVGDGENMVDICYIEDCVEAHIRGMEALLSLPDSRGKAYFISQGEPVKMWQWINEVLKRNSIPQVRKRISKTTALVLAGLMEGLSAIHPGHPQPLLTRFLVSEMATSHYFDISRAKELLGYNPRWSVEEAMNKTFG